MRNPRFRWANDRALIACLAASIATVWGLNGCSETGGHDGSPPREADPQADPQRADAAAEAAIHAIRARFPAAIAERGLSRLDRAPDGVIRGADGAVRVELPAHAAAAARVTDVGSGVAVAFALEGASKIEAAIAGGVALYRAAAPSGGDVVHAVTAAGTEDFVHYAAAPADEELRYRIDVSRVAGLRRIGTTLEMLDAHGAPRLRVAPPEVVDARGRHVQADLSLEGCAADTSPRAPWGRPVTAPGASACTVVVSWRGREVAYPALVDPSWVSTKGMTVERARHALAALPNPVSPPADASPVLVTGGFDKNGQPLASAEIFEPLSRTFATTGAMSKPRAAHTATAIPASPIGQVIVAGGAGSMTDPLPPEKLAITSLADAASTEIYNPQTGVFTPGPAMNAPRYQHTATALLDGRVLFAGGITDLVNQPTKSADLFTYDAASPPGTISPAAGTMSFSRSAHAATRLASGDVLVTGGIGSATFALLSAEMFCFSNGCTAGKDQFAPLTTQMTAARAFHTAVTLPNGDVLVAGGLNAVSAPIAYHATADLFGHSTLAFQLQAIGMGGPRAFHTTTVLSPAELFVPDPASGTVQSAAAILAGGFDGSADLATVEAYIPATETTPPIPASIQALTGTPMSTTRRHAAAFLVNAGEATLGGHGVLVTGGVSGTAMISGTLVNGHSAKSAEVLVKNLGDPCSAAGECLSGFCHDGVCCDVACTEDCWSCTAAKKQDGSADGTCGPSKELTPLPVKCIDDPATNEHVEAHNVCDGAGHAKPWLGTKSCKPGTCDKAGLLCQTVCSSSNDCAVTGWCDLSSPPDGGVGGTCRDKMPNGLGCTANEQCSSEQCVDGYCCESACASQCQACDMPGSVGKCIRVGEVAPGTQPHSNGGARALCEGQGTACMGACGSTSVDKCDYPSPQTELNQPDCTDQDGKPSTIVHHPCDSKGGSTDAPGDCGGFKCADSHACRTTCAADDECIQDHVCSTGDAGAATCVPLTSPLCDGLKTLRKPVADGGYAVCPDHYACPAGAGECLTKCDVVSDCVDGYLCDGAHKCVAALEAPLLPSCAAAPRGAAGAGWAGLFGLLALALRRRRSS